MDFSFTSAQEAQRLALCQSASGWAKADAVRRAILAARAKYRPRRQR